MRRWKLSTRPPCSVPALWTVERHSASGAARVARRFGRRRSARHPIAPRSDPRQHLDAPARHHGPRAIGASFRQGAAHHSRYRLGRRHLHVAGGSIARAAVERRQRRHARPEGHRQQSHAGWICRASVERPIDRGDMFELLEGNRLCNFDIVTANLFLHHFSEPQLSQLLARLAPLAPLFVACEPRRGGLPLLASRLLWVIGCNDVSRHDAAISVRAGFVGSELSALWPERDRWELHEGAARLFTHCFVARHERSRVRDA